MASRETDAIVAYLRSTGVSHRVTSIDSGGHTPGSRHYQAGTGGRGLAVDFAGTAQYVRSPLTATPQLKAIAQALRVVGGFVPGVGL